MSSTERALKLLQTLPRMALNNIKNIHARKKFTPKRGDRTGRYCGRGTSQGQSGHNTLPRLGFETMQTPFYRKIPKEPYYHGLHMKKDYPPLSLRQLQRMIDLFRLDPSQPIDLSQICNTKLFKLDVPNKQYGVQLTDDGIDSFKAKINIEVQWVSEPVIAAIERQGGFITTRYYDPFSLLAMWDPEAWFKSGKPIPRCKMPSTDVVEYYMNPANRGYLADPEKVMEERFKLAQKYGYELPDLSQDEMADMLLLRKDPRQIFFGLQPGWMVNLKDKCVLKPTDEDLVKYYNS